jgi:hypothetical protein
MNQQARQDNDSADTFESDLAQLSERIRKSEWAMSKLCRIVQDGLEVAKDTDTIYYDEGSFSPFKLYLLYKVAFEVWSYQHQAILEILKANKQPQFTKNSQLVLQHQDVVIKMFDALNHLASVNDPDILRNSWLSVWRQTISELTEFVDIPRVYPVKQKNQNVFGFKFALKLPDMSGNTKYVILSTFLLVLAIPIALFLLSHK